MQKYRLFRQRKKYFELTDRLEFPLDLYEHLPFQIAVVSNLLQLNRDPEIRDVVDLEPRELRVILNIGSYMPIKSADIAYQSRMDAYTVSRAVNRLQAFKLVMFEHNESNRKVKFLVLTDEGIVVYHRLCLQIQKRESLIEAKLTDKEKETLMLLLSKLEDNTELMLANKALLKLKDNGNLSADQKEIIRWCNNSQRNSQL